MTRSIPVLLVFLLLAGQQAHAATRVALVSTCGGKAGQNVLALAEAKLSAEKGVAVVERTLVERVLDEQKLTHCGLSDSAQALAVGKLLGVEVFATLETFSGSGEALGLVVFDARSGAKLCDVTLPAGDMEVTANGIVAAVRKACEKRLRPISNRRTVCLLSVRNAELPRAMDSFCESVGQLLERGLLGSASLVVLERKRLEQINRERTLPTDELPADLLPSLTLMELEFSRGSESNEVKATVFLTDASGTSLGKVQAAGRVEQAGNLTESLLQELTESLNATPAAHTVDRSHEARRFQQEARFFIEHMQFAQGLRAAEAAYALNPADQELRAWLADALLKAAGDILSPGQPEVNTWVSKVQPEDLKRAMSLAHRGADLCLEIHTGQPPAPWPLFSQEDKALGQFIQRARSLKEGYDDETRRQLAGLQGKLRRVLVEFWAQRVDPDMSYCCPGNLYWLLNELEFSSATSSAWITDALEVLDHWLAAVDKRGLCNVPTGTVNWMLTPVVYRMKEPSRRYEGCTGQCWSLDETDLARLRNFFDALAQRREPLFQLYGMISEFAAVVRKDHSESNVKPLSKIKDLAKQIIASPSCVKSDDYRAAVYQALLDTIDLLPDPDTRRKEYQELFDFMLERREYVHWVAMATVDPNSQRFAAYQDMGSVLPRNAEEVITKGDAKVCARSLERLLALLDSPDCRRISMPPQSWRGSLEQQLTQLRESLAAQGAELESTAEPPWSNARLVYTGPTALQQPRRIGDSVWGLELVDDQLRLVQVPLDGAPPQRYDRVPAPGPSDKLFCVIAKEKVLIFPPNAAALSTLSESNGLPSRHISAAACCDGKVYVGIGSNSGYQGTAGYLIACDLATTGIETIASSLRKEKHNALDGVDTPFFVRQMAADPARHRVLFSVDIGIYNDGTPVTGLWSVDTTDGKLTHLLPLAEACEWVSEIRDNEVLLGCRHWGKDARYKVFSFDLKTNTSKLMGASESPHADRAVTTGNRACRLPFGAGPPHLLLEDWLWVGRPFCRSPIGSRSPQFLPSFIKGTSFSNFDSPTYFGLSEDRKQLVVGVGNQLWLLDLKPGSAAKDSP